MKKRIFMQWPLALAACAAVPAVQAQAFPSRPVRVVVPFAGESVLADAVADLAQGKPEFPGGP